MPSCLIIILIIIIHKLINCHFNIFSILKFLKTKTISNFYNFPKKVKKYEFIC